MRNLLYTILLGLSVHLTGCGDYLDVVPKNDIQTIETIFEKREDAYHWLRSCYIMLTPHIAEFLNNPAFLGADEIVAGEYCRQKIGPGGLFIGDGLQMAQAPYGVMWHKNEAYGAIRYINIFFEKIGNVYNMEDSEKKLWTAELKALKAHFYFELMRRYGPIILVPENIDPNASLDEMKQPRRPIDEVVNAIVELCDEAIEDLPYLKEKPSTRITYHSKESAATLKAMTLLYAASPLFNGNKMFANFLNKNGERLFPDYDKEKWRKAAEAADEAIKICEAAGKTLVTGNTDRPTKLLNIMKDIEDSALAPDYKNSEAIFYVRNTSGGPCGYILPFFAGEGEGADCYDPHSIGCLGASMKMVEMFYTEHGVPISEDKQWVVAKYSMGRESDEKYTNVLNLNTEILGLHRRREPRFYANIGADRTLWYRMQKSGSEQKYVAQEICAYQGELYGTKITRIDNNTPQNLSGYWIKKYLRSNITFYYYTSRDNTEKGGIIFRLPDLYLASSEAWNEYLDAPDNRVYDPLNKIRERAGILNVQEAWKNYARNPDKVNTKLGMREIIQQEWNIEFAFEGRRFWNLRRWMTAPEELNTPQYGWNVLGSTAETFYHNYDGPIVVWSKRKFNVPRDYFFPIQSEEVLMSECKQNLGW
ncbi:MAG: RagB/SusD family nutrient uptake outer membrane protein [Sanguibacteroides justesenii]|uniref:RagB/SusD family nutrient uptake outer membrane protein n=1 Tax=Butyricimonas faecalis TaxID=2093856 RepID=UPI001D435044|nr:RagB/SusD family nutrient uptake outer membrane protein [Sanguibacteroides justesenii]